MFESMVSFLMVEQLAGQSFRPPLGGIGYDRLLSPNRKPFRTQDGFIGLLPYTSVHWERFLRLIGRDDIATADWVQDPSRRSEKVDQLYAIVADAMPARTTEDWMLRLRELDIPCAKVNHLIDLMDDEHLQAVGMFVDFEHPTEGAMRGVRSPIHVVGAEREPDAPAPILGRDTVEVLAGAGIDGLTIERWAQSGVVIAPPAAPAEPRKSA